MAASRGFNPNTQRNIWLLHRTRRRDELKPLSNRSIQTFHVFALNGTIHPGHDKFNHWIKNTADICMKKTKRRPKMTKTLNFWLKQHKQALSWSNRLRICIRFDQIFYFHWAKVRRNTSGFLTELIKCQLSDKFFQQSLSAGQLPCTDTTTARRPCPDQPKSLQFRLNIANYFWWDHFHN